MNLRRGIGGERAMIFGGAPCPKAIFLKSSHAARSDQTNNEQTKISYGV
jgi:hypothetical protein